MGWGEIVCESVRGRERKIERGLEREVNVGDRVICKRYKGDIVRGRGRERERSRGERKKKKRGRERM
jgi:hypothetical protein